MKPRFLLSDVDLGEEEACAVADVVRSKWLSVGPVTADFENAFREAARSEHAVALSSCTAALHLALMALDVGPGDEVLLPSYTFVATANAVLYRGATPVFVDIVGEHDLNLDVNDLRAKISPRSKAMLVVHMAGFLADMDRIVEIAAEHEIDVVEDACHAIGAGLRGEDGSPLRGRKAGTMGRVGCFSFFANKNLVTGEGGMVVTDDEDVAARVRLARSHGMTNTSWDKAAGRATDYDIVQPGYNYRCTELTSALGLIQLRKLPAANARRRSLVARYRERLAGEPGLTIPFADRLEDSAHHIFAIVLDDAARRPALRRYLDGAGIQTAIHYPPVHEFTHYRERFPLEGGLERTVSVSARELTLPLHPLLSRDDVDTICDTLLEGLAAVSTPGGSSMTSV